MSDRDRADVPASSLTRRTFLGASATFAASALAGCNDPPPEHIVPYVERPRGVTPGRARWFATSALRNGVAVGIVGKTREGRPIKIEGNPRHPFSLGATGAVEQALPMTLYDADRLGAIAHRGTPATFEDFARAFGPSSGRAFVRGAGEGLHLWLPPTSSPLTAELLDRLRERYPRARIWYDPSLAPLSTWRATELVFGRPLAPHYHFERADRVLALDAEIGGAHPAALRWAAEWARRRRPEGSMSRCYAVCATPTGTSAAFDHRLAVRSSEIGALAAALLAALDVPGAPRALATFLERSPHRAWAEAVARDLAAHRGAALVIAGDRQPAPVHVIAALANAALGSVGRTVTYAEPPWLEAGRPAFEPAPLADALDAGEVDALLCLGGNPAYTASGTLRFAERAVRARELVALAEYPTETAALSSWVVPELHVLERWG
ncbi:MAG TPA: oxidoreductase, partial [Sandaracinaceae bacterium]